MRRFPKNTTILDVSLKLCTGTRWCCVVGKLWLSERGGRGRPRERRHCACARLASQLPLGLPSPRPTRTIHSSLCLAMNTKTSCTPHTYTELELTKRWMDENSHIHYARKRWPTFQEISYNKPPGPEHWNPFLSAPFHLQMHNTALKLTTYATIWHRQYSRMKNLLLVAYTHVLL